MNTSVSEKPLVRISGKNAFFKNQGTRSLGGGEGGKCHGKWSTVLPKGQLGTGEVRNLCHRGGGRGASPFGRAGSSQ